MNIDDYLSYTLEPECEVCGCKGAIYNLRGKILCEKCYKEEDNNEVLFEMRKKS